MACATLKRSLELDPLHSPPGSRPKRRRYAPISASPTIPPTRDDTESPFVTVTTRLSPDQIQAHIKEEMRRLHRRKQLHFGDKEGGSPCASGPSSPNSGGLSSDFNTDSLGALQSLSVKTNKEAALFTFPQVGLICERLVREREEQLRALYDQVLSAKLAEQYDTFVKFTHDQIKKRFEAASAPSYLS